MGLLDLPQQAYGGLLGYLNSTPTSPSPLAASRQQGLLSMQGNYDPNRSFAQNALDPQALQSAMNVGLGFSGGGLGIKAYHGSPYDFNAFDASKIGTGEGVQAYGHGLYFAENEPVAQSYRDQLAGKAPMQWEGQPIASRQDWWGLTDRYADKDWRLAKIIDASGGPNGVRGAMDTYEPYTRNASDGPLWQAAMDRFKQGVGPAATGHMYEVDINAQPSSMLDWDKPLNQQSPQVQQALTANAGRYESPLPWTGQPPAPVDNRAASYFLNDLQNRRGNVAAAQALQESGIPGIRYLDRSSRDVGQGTSNYVVFDPSIISILRKYGIAGPLVGSGALASQNQ